MTDQVTNITKRRDQISLEIQALVDKDVQAVLDGGRPSYSQKIVNLAQDENTLSAAIERLRDAG